MKIKTMGAVYVYHSAVVRSLVGGAVIPLTMFVTGYLSGRLIVGAILVIMGKRIESNFESFSQF